MDTGIGKISKRDIASGEQRSLIIPRKAFESLKVTLPSENVQVTVEFQSVKMPTSVQ